MSRRTAREDALRLLYLYDLCSVEPAEAEKIIWGERPPEHKDLKFARELFQGVIEKLPQINEQITAHAENWSLDRMPVVDRNILRLAIYELLYTPQTPHKVVINEAIEISKKYSTTKSKIFINGILDKIKNEQRG